MKTTPATAYAYASGLIGFVDGDTVPEGSIPIAKGNKSALKNIMEVVARHGYQNNVLLVPGVPELKSQVKKIKALKDWLLWCAKNNGKEHRIGVVFMTEIAVAA